ncbi:MULTISPECIES: relaxase/mobilization nuclease domain-containing protein [Streptomycetaceae]|uniref:Relaxase/mobilization nuclease family protein n=1 Tax=Streptantibioticus cattleyicolor (strain ATCC 35852 / DSM 46488 / JCM 4925 / NBRC 14057 / NRRL 8057) TaxID=1003195 RepID=F8K4K5_STREN|nr:MULTISPECIES: mobilization protein [Streptomycetaceae]AEW95161.1 Relaxase/mobilization nuclease family protein [Streptantibioticus cattleyicolor NRRL 8057 = DSM 46488]MYS59746.1 mobilization protein [Streptomyces sp. SID5468]CCB75510.1 putative relaxases/mobilisation protein [Streptantibioticus cattleyicolor NRRL 8057 = DSM 46488]
MVPKIRRGSRTHGLLVYLYGPGKRDEHIDAHLVGSWDGFAPDPGRDTSPDPDPKATLARLAAALDLRVKQAGAKAPAEHVWHCSVRTDPGDRILTDAEWNTVARRLVHAVNLAPEGDPDGCRWVAVRHADDHIHIVATMVRGDLRRPRMNYDFKKAQAECRRIEPEMGLRRLKPGDGTGAKTPTSAERFKAERTGRPEPSRETLRDAVRQAVAGAADENEFFARLREAGLRVQTVALPSGDLRGYKVALPGDRNAAGEPIWFSGSTLAPDLSLPKIRRRLADGKSDEEPLTADGGSRTDWSRPARARRTATGVAERAAAALDGDGDEAVAQLPAVGELLDAIAQTSPAATRAELGAAARAFERATRSHVRAERADTRAVRAAARGIVQAGSALGRGEDGGTTAMLVSTLVLVALAAARWHSARGHAQQAHASRQAAEHLRAAYRQAAATPMQALRDQGRALPEAERRTHEATIRDALPEAGLRADNASMKTDALTATLAQAEKAGHDPKSLLQQAIDLRELDTAEDVNDVLVWRLRRLAQLPAHPGEAPRRPQAGTSQPKTSTNRSSNRTAPTAAAPPTATNPRNRTPRR